MSASSGQSGSHDVPVETGSARYKFQRLRDRLRQAIKTGELSAKLPGERELARRYDANAKTINKALCDLTSEGLLVRHVGRGTFVADGKTPGAASRRKLLTYVWIAPAEPSASELSSTFNLVDGLVRQRGHRLIPVVTPATNNGEITDSAITPGQLRSWDGILLASRASEALLADLHRRHLPTVMVHNTNGRIRTSAVLPDYGQGGFELTEFLIRLGHQEIQLLIDADLNPAACRAEAGYRAAMLRHGCRPRAMIESEGVSDHQPLLRESDRATGWICVGSSLAARVLEEIGRAGLTIPDDISLVVISEAGSDPGPSLTCYQVQPKDLAHWAVELLAGATPGQLPRFILVPGNLVDRGSARAGPVAGRPLGTAPIHADL